MLYRCYLGLNDLDFAECTVDVVIIHRGYGVHASSLWKNFPLQEMNGFVNDSRLRNSGGIQLEAEKSSPSLYGYPLSIRTPDSR